MIHILRPGKGLTPEDVQKIGELMDKAKASITNQEVVMGRVTRMRIDEKTTPSTVHFEDDEGNKVSFPLNLAVAQMMLNWIGKIINISLANNSNDSTSGF